MRIDLHDGWTARAVGGDVPPEIVGVTFPATVPGCVHLDLLAAGLIPDPYLDENELAVAWIARVDWRYEASFDWSVGDDLVDLVALGLDTVATIEINGTELAKTYNMHRTYRLPVGELIREGRNEIAITFAAPLTAAEEASAALGPRPHVNAHPFNALRKMACSFGWDWGPDVATVGIWRPLRLETWHGARLDGVRPLVEVDATTGRLRVHVDVQRVAEGPLTVRVDVAGMTTEVSTGETSMVVEVEVADVDVWWPHGYGDQPLYQVAVTLADEGDVLDVWRGRVGFRNVTLDTSPDDQGTPFTLLVNEIPVFARGVNWIPDDSFPSRVDRARYLERLTQAKDANVNLIRVWGGGIYESDDFYDVCDELGLLVWQDFLFACAAYSEEEPLRSEVIAEARGAVTRLSPHPSLAIWNGCNENIWGYWDWGWQDDLGDRSWGWGYYSEILPAIVEELDPTRPYSPGSPYSFSPDRPPNEQAHGTLHIWDVWNQVDYTVYRDYSPRFVAEFGFQGPPTWATLTQSIHDDPRRSDSPAMLLHQKAEDGNGKLARGLEGHLPQPQTFEDWHWSTSLNQARAVAFGIEHFRSLSPGCMGSIVWQLNDCWPVTSWAAVDGYGRRKPLWYALRHAFVDRLLTFQPRDGDVALVLVNDSSEPWTGDLEVTRRAFDGTVLATVTVQADLASRSTATIALPPELTRAADPKAELLCASSSFGQASWQFVEDVDAALPVAAYDSEIQRIDGGYRVSVTALTFIKDLALLADRVAPDAAVDEMLVSLLPGETATFDVLTAASLTAEDLTSPSVLRCANQLVAQP